MHFVFLGPDPGRLVVSRGIGLLINRHEYKDPSIGVRRGTNKDEENLSATFEPYGCQFEVKKNLKTKDVDQVISRFAQKVEDDPNGYDYLVLVILR